VSGKHPRTRVKRQPTYSTRKKVLATGKDLKILAKGFTNGSPQSTEENTLWPLKEENSCGGGEKAFTKKKNDGRLRRGYSRGGGPKHRGGPEKRQFSLGAPTGNSNPMGRRTFGSLSY